MGGRSSTIHSGLFVFAMSPGCEHRGAAPTCSHHARYGSNRSLCTARAAVAATESKRDAREAMRDTRCLHWSDTTASWNPKVSAYDDPREHSRVRSSPLAPREASALACTRGAGVGERAITAGVSHQARGRSVVHVRKC
eukprot:scaffold138008_cov31-Tisochrysis_lutea.AAC.7